MRKVVWSNHKGKCEKLKLLLLLILSRKRNVNLKGKVSSPGTVPNPLTVLIKVAFLFFLPPPKRLSFSYKSQVDSHRVIQGGTDLLCCVLLLHPKSFQDLVVPTLETADSEFCSRWATSQVPLESIIDTIVRCIQNRTRTQIRLIHVDFQCCITSNIFTFFIINSHQSFMSIITNLKSWSCFCSSLVVLILHSGQTVKWQF